MNGKTLAVFNVDGAFPQSTTPVSIGAARSARGGVEGSIVTCPWHGWQCDVTTGACVANPSAKVERYEVRVEDTDVKVLV